MTGSHCFPQGIMDLNQLLVNQNSNKYPVIDTLSVVDERNKQVLKIPPVEIFVKSIKACFHHTSKAFFPPIQNLCS